MKRLMIVLLVLFVFGISAEAQMGGGMMSGAKMGEQKGEMKPPCMQMGEGQQMPMMQMCMPMMQMMMDMMKMQKKMMSGVKPAESKEMMKEMDEMMERMEKMMSEMKGMMMKGMMEPKPPVPKKEEQKEAPKTEPHKH